MADLEGRAFDAAVAVEVFGWQRPSYLSAQDPWLYPPGADMAVHLTKPVPGYSTDPAADLESHRVACSWPEERKQAYFGELSRILLNRRPGGDRLFPEYDGWLFIMEHYQIGDYSRAALAVVRAEKGGAE